MLKTKESSLQSFILSGKLLFDVAGGCAEARWKNDTNPGNSLKTLQPYDIIFAKFLDQLFPRNLKDRLLALQRALLLFTFYFHFVFIVVHYLQRIPKRPKLYPRTGW